MGGKAFSQTLPPESFPRMSHATYDRLKSLYLHRLRDLYGVVEVPPEDPEKDDHGDLDYLVAFPRDGLTPADVKDALGAVEIIFREGNETSHYAIQADEDGHFVQIDVHACSGSDMLERILFYHSYGGIGMMLGRIAKSISMTLSISTLKISQSDPEECHPVSFKLSDNLDDILTFFGLSLDVWRAGFRTRRALFEWLASSRYFFPARLATGRVVENSSERRRLTRDIYHAFGDFVDEVASLQMPLGTDELIQSRRSSNKQIREEALLYFGKKSEYDDVIHANWVRMRLKTTFTGLKVVEWTNLWGKKVSEVMKETKRRVGGDDAMARLDEEEVRIWVLRVYEDLRLVWDREEAEQSKMTR
ncbi:hypothetical protein GLOTRDRAFT_139061 [Gloeophyllum trabeum ATCC 11539]|uniref:Uncharacterized protein n=1 Tax=Gloeophyllum trabeum (strain ATCC 11539 / FP-39264 / Madison 617) TaxID=670483 RepID=S7RJH1_GLOTA|nr:uncharacterized protein GLOTRDRAFT_139061 [Gloeophyllum trabeum ATCC 11539]EPQ54475.1 hypothetical protein GLOTRDRAFT_139061 [Gloeophyllum trabeum ATCC 11539]